jgi:hypothetical protein
MPRAEKKLTCPRCKKSAKFLIGVGHPGSPGYQDVCLECFKGALKRAGEFVRRFALDISRVRPTCQCVAKGEAR